MCLLNYVCCVAPQVTIHLTACCPAYNGLQMTGQRIYSTRDKGRGPLTLQLGQGLLPPGGCA